MPANFPKRAVSQKLRLISRKFYPTLYECKLIADGIVLKPRAFNISIYSLGADFGLRNKNEKKKKCAREAGHIYIKFEKFIW